MNKQWISLLLVSILAVGLIAGGAVGMSIPASAEALYEFYVYEDAESENNHYQDIAYMGSKSNGDDGTMTIDLSHTETPKSGDTCIAVSYTPKGKNHWAGMMWLSGEGNFPPDLPKDGVDMAMAKTLTFWAKGSGKAEFFIEDNSKHKVSAQISLTDEWTEYTLAIPSDWDAVCIGFGWASSAANVGGDTMSFYLDDIRFDG